MRRKISRIHWEEGSHPLVPFLVPDTNTKKYGINSLSLPVPIPEEKKKYKLHFYFRTSLSCLKRFYEGLECENKNLTSFLFQYNFQKCTGREGLILRGSVLWNNLPANLKEYQSLLEVKLFLKQNGSLPCFFSACTI